MVQTHVSTVRAILQAISDRRSFSIGQYQIVFYLGNIRSFSTSANLRVTKLRRVTLLAMLHRVSLSLLIKLNSFQSQTLPRSLGFLCFPTELYQEKL